MIQPIELHITGMTCGHCQKFVHETLAELRGVSEVSVDQKTGIAHLNIDTDVIAEQDVCEAIHATGAYQVAKA